MLRRIRGTWDRMEWHGMAWEERVAGEEEHMEGGLGGAVGCKTEELAGVMRHMSRVRMLMMMVWVHRGQYSDAVLSELENQNDQHLAGISAKVKMLKDVRLRSPQALPSTPSFPPPPFPPTLSSLQPFPIHPISSTLTDPLPYRSPSPSATKSAPPPPSPNP